MVDQDGRAAKLNPVEAERVMGFREGYTGGCGLSDRQRLEALGNGWDVGTIEQIFSFLL